MQIKMAMTDKCVIYKNPRQALIANRKIHFIERFNSPAKYLCLKNKHNDKKSSSTTSGTRLSSESRSESRTQGSNEIATINSTVRHVGLGSFNKCVNYISFSNSYSKSIALKPLLGQKSGRPRKLQNNKVLSKRKKTKRQNKKQDVNKGKKSVQTSDIQAHGITTTVVAASSLAEALHSIEKRKKSIKAKLILKKESLLTQEEEHDIHTRADIYAMTAIPDPDFYILPGDDPLPTPPMKPENVHIVTYPTVRKKRRRNYGVTTCYVNQHNEEDVFDNTKTLPIGTRLLKPPTKLVELVAHAIDGSPDGLLQVQQIYRYLQNKFPFFRYMERVSINSWRSSIRHALYQKWFRKIRFDLSYISSKGCYWAINHKTSPKEWTMPDCIPKPDEEKQEDTNLEDLAMDPELHDNVCALLEEENNLDPQNHSDVIAIAKEIGIAMKDRDDDSDLIDVDLFCDGQDDHHSNQGVKELDPVLATYVPDLTADDVYISSGDSLTGTLSPSMNSLCSPIRTPTLPTTSDRHGLQFGSPLNKFGSPLNSYYSDFEDSLLRKCSDLSELQKEKLQTLDQLQNRCPISPMLNWTPNWEEYGSYILSPQQSSTSQYYNTGLQDDSFSTHTDIDTCIPMDLSPSDLQMYDHTRNLSKDFYSSDSSISSNFEVIAEYTNQDLGIEDTDFHYG